MKSNLLYKVFAIILSIPLIALLFGGAVGNASESSQTGSASSAATATYEPTR